MRLGLLSAARISAPAVVEPAKALGNVEVAAVGARELSKAQSFAEQHDIPTAYGSYHELLEDYSLDAIYVGTPNSLHRDWTVAALKEGFHVLCEKPLAGNRADAELMVETSRDTGNVLMEAFHWRFHAFADSMIEQVSRLQPPVEIEAVFNVASVPHDNIRYQADLGGGALMDLGCYPVHWVRTLLGEPISIEAEMDVTVEEIDDTTRATMTFPDGSSASISASFVGGEMRAYLGAKASNGTVRADNPLAPQRGNRLSWNIEGESDHLELGGPSTYEAQLRFFADLIDGTVSPLVTLEDSVANMAVIDAMYLDAGLPLRP